MTPRFLNRPLALLPDNIDTLRHGSGLVALAPEDARAAADRDYSVAEGVAVIPVMGALSHGAVWSWYDETSYDSIRRCLSHALANDQVRAIVLHVNSPGGDVAGCFDLADAIYRSRGTKPLWAILDENAYSAAYALASACDRVIVPRTGGTGSIGVLAMHTDLSGALDQAGIKITTITYGARKADGNPTEPLADAALEKMQSSVDKMGELFVRTAARNRGMSRAAVRATEGGTFMGQAGVAAHLADEVMSPDEAFLALLGSLPVPSSGPVRPRSVASRADTTRTASRTAAIRPDPDRIRAQLRAVVRRPLPLVSRP